MPYRVSIDESACSAHGECEALAPEVFRVDDVASVIGTGPDELILGIARICPAVAIIVTDESSAAQVFP